MTRIEVKLIATLLRWAAHRIVAALGTGAQIMSYREDGVLHKAEDESLIDEVLSK